MKGYIYKLHNAKGYYYYGSTINPSDRHQQHYIAFKAGKKSKLYEQMKLDGFESFTMDIIETVTDIMNIKRGVKIAESKYIKQSLGDEFNLNDVNSFRDYDKDNAKRFVFTEQYNLDDDLLENIETVHAENSVNVPNRQFTISNTVLSSSEEKMEHIIHISDIHIRVGNHDKSRYTEYLIVFNNLFQSLAQLECLQSSVIVITGDLFHHKNKLEPYGLELTLHLFRGLSALAPVFVIRGNHDYRQDVPHEKDMITALMSYNIPNLHYLDKTDVYNFKNLSFGLVAIQDTLLYGATTGISPNLPPFPKGTAQYNVALFHGTISGCTLQTGQTTLNGYPIDWFQGFDAILLGDIHLQQVNRADPIDYTFAPLPSTSHVKTFSYQQSPWGYPGSLIQQDFGEPLFGHGYLLWNLKDKLVHAFHVHNPYGFVKMKNEEIIIDKKYISLHSVISQNWFPNALKISVLGNPSDLKCFETKNIMFVKTSEEKEQKTEQTDAIQINTFEILIEYIQNKIMKDKKLFSDAWKGWLKNPEQLLISTAGYPENIAKKISDRSDKILKESTKYLDDFEKITSQHLIHGKLHIHTLQWNWILNYRDGNHYDFDKDTKKISIINAKNGSGKSNFLEIICIALFGEGFPSRENPHYTAGIICDKKPAGIMASTSITFSIDDKKYSLLRVMRPNSNARQINFEKIILSEVRDQDVILHQQKGAVHPWIETHIGTLETYLMTAMLSQNADRDFFSLDKVTQKTLLDKIMSMDHINSLKAFFKETDKYYKYCSDIIESYYQGAIGGRDPHLGKQLEDAKRSVQTLQMTTTALQNKWNHVSERDLAIDMVDAQMKYDEWMSLDIPDLSVLQSLLLQNKNNHAAYTKVFVDYHSFTDILPSVVSTESYESVIESVIQLKQSLEEHPYYKSYSLYTLSAAHLVVDLDVKLEVDVHHLFQMNKEFESWDAITSSEYSEVFDDQDVSDALESASQICNEYPSQISELSKHIKIARKKYLIIRREKDELSESRPNKPSKSGEWLDETRELLCHDIHYIMYLEGLLLDSIQNVPLLCTTLLSSQQKCQEMKEYIGSCSDIPFNAKCKACKEQPWKKTFDAYQRELPLLERSISQMTLEVTEYIYEDIPFEIASYTEYITAATDVLSKCSHYIQLHTLYSSQELLMTEYDTWQKEYDIVCQKHDDAESYSDRLETMLKEKEGVLHSAILEKHSLETKQKQIEEKRAAYDLYCSERARRLLDYQQNNVMLDASWYTLLRMYHTSIRTLLGVAKQKLESTVTEREETLLLIETAKQNMQLRSRAIELRSIMDAHPHWIAWKMEVEQLRSAQLLVRELETRYGNKTDGVDMSAIRSVMEVVAYLSNTFDEYREWLYKEHIAPLIMNSVNSVLSLVCEDRPLRLEGEWLDKISTLSWFVRDGSSRPIIEKASGFQRFIVGMACRVAFHQIGFCRIQYDQLFLDEGFTSCDADNLERVPDFLRSLLQMYDSIYLATHLDELKVCADSHIVIDRDMSGLSQIASASTATASVTVVEPKKKGRPSKKVCVTRSD
jgi:DNA repair exonuclease SbcCD ATPase subunit